MLSRISSWRPQPAIIIACLALFVALGGTSYAAVKLAKNSVGTREIKTNGVSSAEIKAKAVAASEVKDDALTGTDINESTLGNVPSATSAASATTASNVGGTEFKKINFRAANGTALTPILTAAGLTVSASCLGNIIDVSATTTKQDSSIYSYTSSDTVENDPDQDDRESGAFDVGVTFDVLGSGPNGGGNVSFAEFEFEASDGSVVSGTIQTDTGGTSQCIATGHAIIN